LNTKPTNKTRIRNEDTSGNVTGILVCSAIAFGVFIQVGRSVYISNVLLKVIGITIPTIIAMLILSFRKNRTNINFSIPSLFLFILYLAHQTYLALSSLSFGRYFMGTADRNLGGIISAIAILSFLIGFYLGNKNRVWILYVVVLVAVIQSFTVGYQKFLKADVLNSKGSLEAPAILGTFYNANPLSYFLGIVASGLFGYLLCTRSQSKRFVISIISLFALVLGLHWSASSQGLIGLIAVIALFSLQKIVPTFRRNFHTLLTFSYVTALVIFFIAIVVTPLNSDSNFGSNPYLERLEIYKSALLMISHNLAMGVGVDNFASQYGTYTLSTDLKLVDNAHSIPLHLLSTQGVVGLFFYCIFILFILRLKPKEIVTPSNDWAFWQAMFFASAMIGIIGIEHPVISLLSFLSAGFLMSMSDRQRLFKPENISLHHQKILGAFAITFAIGISSSLLHFSQSEIRAASALTKLSNGVITPDQFVVSLRNNSQSIYNARVLLTTGQAFIAIDNRLAANNVARIMLSRYPDDQRTSVMFFAIADMWNDNEALSVAIRLRNQLFPNSK
jgi:hypothetical protein